MKNSVTYPFLAMKLAIPLAPSTIAPAVVAAMARVRNSNVVH
jgi:hypothetical protein